MIRKGEAWGSPVAPTGDEPLARTDAELAVLLTPEEGRPPLIRLAGGDLHHSLGGSPVIVPGDEGPAVALPIDAIRVTSPTWNGVAVAHVVVRARAWRGPFAVAMGGTHLGDWNLGPRAHPNDGLIDVTEGALGLRDRLAARRRAPAGAHLPHPALRTKRAATHDIVAAAGRRLVVDGVDRGPATTVHLDVLPDRGTIVLV